MTELMYHPRTGQRRTAPTGFSWPSLFLGGSVPLYRGDYKWFFLWFLIALCTFGIGWLVMPFRYNDIYLNHLHREGFVAEDGHLA